MNKPYRSIQFNDERKWKFPSSPDWFSQDDVIQVGLQKAIGYVPLKMAGTISEAEAELTPFFTKRGQIVIFVPRNDKSHCIGLLYAGCPKMMQPIINLQKEVLIASNWPTNPKGVLHMIAQNSVRHEDNKSLYHLIADLFNSWCLFCERPIWMKDGKYLDEPLSENPYDPNDE